MSDTGSTSAISVTATSISLCPVTTFDLEFGFWFVGIWIWFVVVRDIITLAWFTLGSYFLGASSQIVCVY
jgi:hypothetical protein